MRIERISAAILVASWCATTVFGASPATAVHKSGKTSGNIFDGSKPQANPRECYVTVTSSAEGRDVWISTDQPFRATSQGQTVPGIGPRYLAFHFTIPSGFSGEPGADATTDAEGYRLSASPDAKAAKAGEEGATKLVVKFTGQDNSIIKESAEITLTREFVPVQVKVDALTKRPDFNRESRLTCGQFTPVELEPEPEPEQAQRAAGTQEVFWQSLQDLCGKAFAHIQDKPVASTPILDVRKCDEQSVLFGVHYLKPAPEPEWNRGQSWLITKMPDGLHMKYTRTESAEPGAKQGGWSATTRDAGTSDLQIFAPDESTVAASPSLKNFGWALRLQQGDSGGARLVYQAVEKVDTEEQARGGYAFDLSTPIDPPAEPPWGLSP